MLPLFVPKLEEVLEYGHYRKQRERRPRDRVPFHHALGISATRHALFTGAPVVQPAAIFPSGFQAWWQHNTGYSVVGSTTLEDANNFTVAAWTKVGVTVTGGQSDPAGGATASLITESAINTQHGIFHSFSNQATGALMRVTLYAKANGRNWLWIGANTSDRIYVNLSSGAVGTVGSNVRNTAVYGLSGGWLLIEYYVRASNNNLTIGLASADNTDTYIGDGTSGAFVYLADIYQRRLGQWNDSSGQGQHVVMATESQRPFIEPDGSGITFLAPMQQCLERTTGGQSANSDHCMFIKLRVNTILSNFGGYLSYGRSASGTASTLIGESNGPGRWYGGGGTVSATGNSPVTTNGMLMRLAKNHSGTTTQGYRDGAVDGSSGVITYTRAANPGFIIGARVNTVPSTNCTNITVKDAVIANVSASAAQLAAMDRYHQGVP